MTDDTTVSVGQKCSERVRSEGRWLSFHQCPRPGSVERDGKFFCKQHDPVAVRSKRAARDARWKSEWDTECAKRAETAAALRSFEPMRDALTLLRGQYILFVGPDDDIANAVLAQVDAALALAE